MKDIVKKAAKEPLEKIIPWITDDLCTSLKNKTEGPKAKIGHSQGSISAIMWVERLV